MKNRTNVFMLAALAGGVMASAAQAQILVYDQNSRNSYALAAAERVRPGDVVRAGSGDFNALLASGGWELVVMDFPSTAPTGGIDTLANFVNDGGRAILSTWFAQYTPAVFDAFGATGGTSISTVGQTLESTGTALADAVFDGVPMPHSLWFNNWGSDGAAFTTQPGTEVIATLNGAGQVVISANEGRSIASFVIDEWNGLDGAVQLWENMMNVVLDGAGEPCFADFDGDGSLTLFDFLEYQNAFGAGDLRADCDGDGALTLFDFLCFQNAFALGCE